MRGHFFNNEPEKGDSLGWKYLNGRKTSFGTHVPVGDLVLEMNTGKNAVSGYSRCLDLADAVTSVTYDSGDVTYTREYIASFPEIVGSGIGLSGPHRYFIKGNTVSLYTSINHTRKAPIPDRQQYR